MFYLLILFYFFAVNSKHPMDIDHILVKGTSPTLAKPETSKIMQTLIYHYDCDLEKWEEGRLKRELSSQFVQLGIKKKCIIIKTYLYSSVAYFTTESMRGLKSEIANDFVIKILQISIQYIRTRDQLRRNTLQIKCKLVSTI